MTREEEIRELRAAVVAAERERDVAVAAFHDASRLRSEIQQARIEAEDERDAAITRAEKAEAGVASLLARLESQSGAIDAVREQASEAEADARALREARRERDEIIGNGEAMNDGPNSHCTDCGRRMVWERPPTPTTGDTYPSPGSWMCPRCVMERCRRAERSLTIKDNAGDMLLATAEGALEGALAIRAKLAKAVEALRGPLDRLVELGSDEHLAEWKKAHELISLLRRDRDRLRKWLCYWCRAAIENGMLFRIGESDFDAALRGDSPPRQRRKP